MAKSVDYLGMEKGSYHPPRPKHPTFQRTRSFREIQGIISKMNPELVKSVIQNGSSSTNNKSFVSDFPPYLPLCDYTLRLSCGGDEKNCVKYTSPLTIFYNGSVSVFQVSPQKAEDILKFGEQQTIHNLEINSHDQQYQYLTQSLNDLPITQRISLQRFLEKRRERLIMLSPYYFPTNNSNFNSNSNSTRKR